MKINIIGYGKMGKAIAAYAQIRGHEIAGIADDPQALLQLPAADVAIEFSQPDAVIHNLLYCFERKLPVVCGTTGWTTQRAAMEAKCLEMHACLFHASNFSLGVNIFFKVNAYLAQLLTRVNDYHLTINETHHTQKKDAPSGTAITLAEGILKNNPLWKNWTTTQNPMADEFVINSFRVDPLPGTHEIRYDSEIDSIEIKHTAHSRDGFVKGAVLAAEWINGKTGVYTMEDILKF